MRKNIIANFIGRFWGVLSNFIFLPLYIEILGLENFSIISFTLVLTSILALMDAGMTSTLTREFASSLNSSKKKKKIFKTLESCYFLIAFISTASIFFFSDIISSKWLILEDLNPKDVSYYLKIIAFELGFKFLFQFYSGGLLGLDKQVKVNAFSVGWGLTRNGLVLIPIFFQPSLEVFFLWQTISTIIFVVLIRISLLSNLKSKLNFFSIPTINVNILKQVWKFAGGMMLISMVAGISTQMDKIVLSKLLTIEVLGIYTLAFSLSRGLSFLSTPLSKALLPRLTLLYSQKKINQAQRLFNFSNILVAITIFSFASCMIIYSQEILWIWTDNKTLSQKASVYVPWILLGTAFLSMQNLPFSIAIANGFTKYNNYLGLSSLVITLPGYWLLTDLYGGVGAAITFSFVQILTAFIYLFLINRKFLNLPSLELFTRSFIFPVLISVITSYVVKDIIYIRETKVLLILKIGLTVFSSFLINFLVLFFYKEIREDLLKQITGIYHAKFKT